ncbi:MAG: ABC transporter ATP-binding protein [Saccharofermentanales bacterium]|jgi:oligopeptide transport system ATP-binding protein
MLLQVNRLKKYFNLSRNKYLKAVDDVSFSIDKGETMGLVGESGCGKSTLGYTIVGLHKPTDGTVFFDGKNVQQMAANSRAELSRNIQMIFQDPYSSLNPRMTVSDIICEGIDIHGLASGQKRNEILYELLDKVGLAKEHANRFPHEFSGGQRQRIGIARALAIQPRMIVCDEPISALDVSIQAQVVNLLEDLQKELRLTYLFITHDIGMVAHIAKRIAVMYLGVITEIASSDVLITEALHPYTQALLSAAPFADPIDSRARNRIKLAGDVPDPITVTSACKFYSRCPIAKHFCLENIPSLKEVREGHMVACHAVIKEKGYE